MGRGGSIILNNVNGNNDDEYGGSDILVGLDETCQIKRSGDTTYNVNFIVYLTNICHTYHIYK